MDPYAEYRRRPLKPENLTEFPQRQRFRPYTLSPEDGGYAIEDVWPSLYFGSERASEAQRKLVSLSWAHDLVERMRDEATNVIDLEPQLPIARVGWRHDFYSRETGAHLLYEPEQSGYFLDPSTRKREHDEAQRRAWFLLTHERTYRMMRSLGLLYRLTRDEAFAEWVVRGLRKVVEYCGHHEFRKGEALYFSSLYDAGIVLLIANTYDLVRDCEAITPEDHESIRTGFFEDRVSSLLKFLDGRGVHNMSCFAAAAIATAGEVLDIPEWTERALCGKNGLQSLLLFGIREIDAGEFDGFWHEGTTFYHFYSLCALVPLFEIGCRNDAITPELRQRFEAMFAAPVELSDQQLRVPPLGDLGDPHTMHLGAYRHLYEYAAGCLNPQRFGPVLAAIYESVPGARREISSLVYGPDELPTAASPDESTLLPVANIGVFRAMQPEPFWLAFRAGKYSGGHDHPDRLSVFLHARGLPISPDLGEPGYSLRDIHSNWFRSTLAHNTLFVNEADQTAPATLSWRSNEEPPCARGVVQFDGIEMRRTVFFAPPYFVLLDEFEAEAEQRFGWVYHAYGNIELEEQVREVTSLELPPLPGDGAWRNLVDAKSRVGREVKATWRVTEALGLHLRQRCDSPVEITTSITPGQPYRDFRGTLLLRAPGCSLRVASVFEVSTAAPKIQQVHFNGEFGVRVELADGSHRTYTWFTF